MHVCSVAKSDTKSISTHFYITCPCMTYKEHHVQCAVSSWHQMNMICCNLCHVLSSSTKHILLSVKNIDLTQLEKQTHHGKCHTY